MNFFFDENLPPRLAQALNILDTNNTVQWIPDKLQQRGVADEIWIPELAKYDGIAITSDLNIRKLRHQRELFMKHKLGVFFLKPPSKKGFDPWNITKLMINKWEEIVNLSKKTEKPFSYRIPAKGKIELLK